MDSMPAPNHNLSVSVKMEGPYPEDLRRYPILNLQLPETEGCGHADRLAFYAKLHKLAHWTDNYRPLDLCDSCSKKANSNFVTVPPSPTWMDPVVYIMMVERSPEAQEALAAYAQKPSGSTRRALEAVLLELLQTAYHVFVEKKFAEALPQFTRWLAANFLQTKEDEREQRKRDASRKSESSSPAEPASSGGRVPLPRLRKSS